MFNAKDFKEYRNAIGFNAQKDLKTFLSAKDIKADINFQYIDDLTIRLKKILNSLNSVVYDDLKQQNINEFITVNIDNILVKLKQHNILPKLNNQGRRIEQVYFSWMRGFVICKFFAKALSLIFVVDEKEIVWVGKDNLDNPLLFARQPEADFELKLQDNVIRFEIQSGYQGINDIKEHKVREAKKQYKENGIISVVIHFDLFNGQVAFVNISQIQDDDINWITRQQMEGQTVFNIDQSFFVWKLIEKPPLVSEIKEIIFGE